MPKELKDGDILALGTMDLDILAEFIEVHWKTVSPHARPYLEAMKNLKSIKDNYYLDSGSSMVAYFLSNAMSWRGDVARRVKAELNTRLKEA